MQKCDLFKGHNSKVPNANWLDNQLGKDFMPLIILSKFADNPLKYIEVRGETTVICQNLTYSRAITHAVCANRLDIKLDPYCMPINNFGDVPMKIMRADICKM